MKKRRITIILILAIGILLSSCSRAYEPINVRKNKGRCGDCSRW